ncbi:uncharacterized protein CANTADRAFT_262709 [Suhomyces tanzawaensis NRRL Y-17324]|uniref:Uncharacterized protein n=1 Tax=Suhomyces tanzawaensis NRRL Y-17324 TaxID=984487 RepID=A0A1E4SFI1_9ASCO|nr:uncharacterized protein CANTADRAFT_262709 [Suhomyces tanzawaensis NRRL Y-17324]ODV78274.1 hypothetical protein CANTADRAFT_262709 [Suhomyces tanzawaensis NRRL Y-17324]
MWAKFLALYQCDLDTELELFQKSNSNGSIELCSLDNHNASPRHIINTSKLANKIITCINFIYFTFLFSINLFNTTDVGK